jgi:hypothetical protein
MICTKGTPYSADEPEPCVEHHIMVVRGEFSWVMTVQYFFGGDCKMKRVLLLINICIVTGLFPTASMAQDVWVQWLTLTRTPDALDGRDLLEFTLVPHWSIRNVAIAGIEGTWYEYDHHHDAIMLSSSTSYWQSRTGLNGPLSHVQLPVNTGGSFYRRGSSDGTYFNAREFSGSWSTLSPYRMLSPTGLDPDGNPLGKLLAQIYVGKDQHVGFSGKVSWVGSGPLGGHTTTEYFTTWVEPEPGSLVLLTTGALALLAYAWRRRCRHV